MIGSESSRGAYLLAGALMVLGCAGTGAGNARDPSSAHGGAPVHPVPVSDEDFAERTYQVLLDAEPSVDRQNLLVGVVHRQIARSQARFESGNEAAGLRALLGAFFLVRAGEYRTELLQGSSKALMAGANEVSRLGQEGYALAFYSMLKSQLPAGHERSEVEAHLQAIQDFSRSTHGDGPLEAASNDARVALQRALVEATPEALDAAREAIVQWVRGALAASGNEQALRSNADRDEALEGYRALRGGTIALVALYLRHGDAKGALTAISRADLDRLFPPELSEQLEHAADDSDPDAWTQLYRLFDSAAQSENSIALIDSEPMAAAAFGSALELYRARPGSIQGALPLAAQLARYGMAEVSSPVLAAAINSESPPEHVSIALAMVLNSLVAEDASGQLAAARRVFSGAEPLLELSERRSLLGKVTPSAARLRYVMAAVEARHGETSRALPLIQRSIVSEPTTESLTLMASLERQRNRPDAAIEALDRVIGQARSGGDAIAHTDALIHKFETLRDAGRAALAQKALDEALGQAVEAQRQGRPGPSQARIERLLARVLEQYGNQPGVHRATQRAYAAANGDVRQLSATVLDASRRALTVGDLAAARAAAQRAIEAKLGADEIVYVALWLQLLERWLNVPSDGTTEEAYATIDEASGWPAKLRSWARGRLSDAELTAAARDAAERTEARFYTALSATAPSAPEAKMALRDVAKSGAIDLIEVTIARDLLAPRGAYVLPPKIAVP
jgi:cellulose synthase operon protein C